MLQWLFFVAIVIGFLNGNPVVLLFFPGILLLPLIKKTLSERVVYIIGISLAFWIISAWFMKFIGVSFFSFVYGILLISLIMMPFILKKSHLFERKEIIPLIVFLIIIGIRFIPYTQYIVAPGPGDMSEHTYPVVLILWNNGLPDSYRPLLPIDHFGAYAAGFHTLAALFSWFGAIPEYRSTFILSLLAHALITLGLYVLLKPFFSWKVSLMTSVFASFFTTYPQLIFHWGGNPTVLSFFFVILFAAAQISNMQTVFSALFLTASLLTHVIPFLSMFYSFVFVSLCVLLYQKIKKYPSKDYITRAILLFLIMFIFILPYLYYLQIDVKGEETLFRKVYYSHGAFPAIKLSLFTELLAVGPVQSIAYTSIPLVLLAGLGSFFCWRNRQLFFITSTFFIAICLLIINIKFWILPFTFAFRSDRVSMLFLLPFTFWIAALTAQHQRRIAMLIVSLLCFSVLFFSVNGPYTFSSSPYGIDRTQVTAQHAVKLGIFQLAGGPAYLFLLGMQEDSLVTKEDIDAFLWIRENTAPEALFLNNKIDAGPWIPAIAYRPVVLPQIPGNFKEELIEAYNLRKFMKDEPDTNLTRSRSLAYLPTEANELRERNITYVYIGKKHLADTYPLLTKENFTTQQNYRLVYDTGGVSIFQVVLGKNEE